MAGSARRMIATPPGARRSRRVAVSRPRATGRPPIRGVIVLTVKLFGETLKAPRTLAVWHG
ncbi:hypothetical protein B1H29_10680 [Streptomyces pactum]|uniref:Uncharacterized protein n=1 Tax=Streptomyces pactum TaxID=68249 RepID=A0A1S6J6E0_9ACTN|nr:hypothetical protein B1H29_10680 [Streptomyces pactum]